MNVLIRQTRINNMSVFSSVKEGAPVYIKVGDIKRFPQKLKKFGFESDMNNGDSILPTVFNNYAQKNAEMFFTIDSSLPMEKYTQTQYWTRNEWAGRGETREVTEFVDITRWRRHRDWHQPYSVNFTYIDQGKVSAYIVSDCIIYNAENHNKLKNTVNMLLGLFGECTIDYEPIPHEIKRKRLDWEILPPGKYPWEKVKSSIEEITEKSNRTQTEMMLRNCKVIADMEPEFVAYGKSGFRGYVVFGFPQKDIFILESVLPNNATYVFNNNWESLSKLSKAEILSNHLHHARIIHSSNWEKAFAAVMNETK